MKKTIISIALVALLIPTLASAGWLDDFSNMLKRFGDLLTQQKEQSEQQVEQQAEPQFGASRLHPAYGGTGQNFSSATGTIRVDAGVFSTSTIPAGDISLDTGKILVGDASNLAEATTTLTLTDLTVTASTSLVDLDVSNAFTLGGTVGAGGIDLNGEQLILDPDGGMILQASVNDLLGITGGFVGIGTTSPNYGLEVMASSTNGYFGVSGSTQGDVFSIDASGNLTAAGTVVGSNITTASSTAWDWAADYLIASSTRIESAVDSAFDWILSGTNLYATDTALTIGIGTSTPSYTLDVWGSAAFGTTTVPALFVNSDTGNVGIGTSSPAEKVDIVGLSTTRLIITDSSSGGTARMVIGGTSAYFGGGINTDTIFQADADNYMVIKSTGLVGIGTTSPAYGLELMASSTTGFFGVSSSVQGDLFVIDASGNVGIGTSSPAYLLEVNDGDAYFDEDVYTGSIEFTEDGGMVTAMDMPVSSSAIDDTIEGYQFKIDGITGLVIYSQSDGAGLVDNIRIGVGTTTPVADFEVVDRTNASTTIRIGSESIPGCVILGDDDSAGITYITALNGVLTATDTQPVICK